MNRSALFVQAIRGPILLITLGVLFALEQSGVVSFTRTWPLIIIMVGMMKLLERMAGPPQGIPPEAVRSQAMPPGARPQ